MEEITACTMDCPDSCSLVVARDAEGEVHIRGNPEHPVTAGFTCKKAKDFYRRIQSPNRIVTPMIRNGLKWSALTWDEALDLCAEKIRENRAEPSSILHIHGEGSKGVSKQASRLFFARLGSSMLRGSLCDAAGYVACVADFGSRDNNDITDLLNSARIVNWGKDLSRSSVHTAALVRKARRNGTRVLSISPGGDGNATFSDETIRIRPGTDRFLAAAVLRLLIDRDAFEADVLTHVKDWDAFRRLIEARDTDDLFARCGVVKREAETVYSFYAGPDPTATIMGAGLQRHSFGGENARFINALALLSGNIGRSGGGSYFHLHSLRNVNLDWTKDRDRKSRRSLLAPTVGRDILAAQGPPIRMLWVNGSNIVNQAPNCGETVRAFESIDFKVVVDAFMNDTAERADLFLPCALMLEQEDIVASYLHDFVHFVKPVFTPPGQARSDYEILRDLGRRLDPPIDLPSPEECFRASLNTPLLDISLEELRERRFVRAKRPHVAYEGMRFAHSDGKYRFPPELHDEPSPPDGYPLRLLSLIRGDRIHSQILPEDHPGEPIVWVSPDNPCLTNVDPAKDTFVVSPVGRLKVKLEIARDLHPDVALYRRGDWMKLGGGINRIIESGLTDIGSGAPFYRQYVRIENG